MKIKIALCSLLLALAGCSSAFANENSNDKNTYVVSEQENKAEEHQITGKITKETGSIHDYTGWWSLTHNIENFPFAHLEINGDFVNCYDNDGNLLDNAFADYSEQRALNGKALIVFVFEQLGEFPTHVARDANGISLDIFLNDDFYSFIYQKLPPFDFSE